jgi:nucleolar complex protein 2
MAKPSKRSRKFNSSGGVKGRLQKGTIIKKGKTKTNKKRSSNSNNDGDDALKREKMNSYANEIQQKREDGDFVSEKNLGDLDMESFFTIFADSVDAVEDADDVVSSDGSDNEDEGIEGDTLVERQAIKRARKKTENLVAKGKASFDSDDSGSEEEDLDILEHRMKEEMGKLQSEDPEFHEFLRENDGSLLEYGGQGDKDDEDDMDIDGAEKDKRSLPKPEIQPPDGNMLRMTPALLQKLEKGAFQMHGIKALKKLVNAYKSACHLTDAEEDGQAKVQGQKYYIESSEVFDRLMVVSLTQCHEEFRYHLLGKGSTQKIPLHKKKGYVEKQGGDDDSDDEDFDPTKAINPKTLEKSLRWADVKPLLLNFLKASLYILIEAKEPELVVYILKSLSNYMVYITPFPQLAERILKTLTSLWSAPIDSSEDYQVVRLHSFLRIRQLALTQPFPLIEECLKKLYLAYAQRAKFATAASVTSALPTLTFMGNCIVELYSLDYHSSYQHAFVYIRQLALHLRTAMQKKTPEAMGAVYCWQYLHCLKLWVAVLTEACQASEDANGEDQLLRSLIFPLSQVILGTISLIPSTRYLPLRLHCVRLLQQLAAAAEMFVPTTSILLDVFDLREIYQAPKKVNKSNVQPLTLTFRLRADNPLRTMEELETCISEVFVLLNREVGLYQYSPGFPEFSVRISQRLRKVRVTQYFGIRRKP